MARSRHPDAPSAKLPNGKQNPAYRKWYWAANPDKREARNHQQAAYNKSEAGKATWERWHKSPKGIQYRRTKAATPHSNAIKCIHCGHSPWFGDRFSSYEDAVDGRMWCSGSDKWFFACKECRDDMPEQCVPRLSPLELEFRQHVGLLRMRRVFYSDGGLNCMWKRTLLAELSEEDLCEQSRIENDDGPTGYAPIWPPVYFEEPYVGDYAI